MISLSSYLDELKRNKDLNSDSDIARFLHVSRAHISQIRAGGHMGELKCYELALQLKREPLELLSMNRAIRTKDARLREYWIGIHNKHV